MAWPVFLRDVCRCAAEPVVAPDAKKAGAGELSCIVCVGGSAGGLEAYTILLRHLPADMGVAIVIVNHRRTIATLLDEILPRYTRMPVELITE